LPSSGFVSSCSGAWFAPELIRYSPDSEQAIRELSLLTTTDALGPILANFSVVLACPFLLVSIRPLCVCFLLDYRRAYLSGGFLLVDSSSSLSPHFCPNGCRLSTDGLCFVPLGFGGLCCLDLGTALVFFYPIFPNPISLSFSARIRMRPLTGSSFLVFFFFEFCFQLIFCFATPSFLTNPSRMSGSIVFFFCAFS